MPSRSLPQLCVVCCTLLDGTLATLVTESGGSRVLPTDAVPERGSVEGAAEALVRQLLGRAPAWLAQAGATVDEGLRLTVAAIVPAGTPAPAGMQWIPAVRAGATVGAAGGASVRAALAAMRDRLDREPVAFRLLGTHFTLSDLQLVYELLLERRVHKASFRRALLAAHLVEPTDTWKSEGRGRPAQLFRFSPRRRRGVQRSVRFELLG